LQDKTKAHLSLLVANIIYGINYSVAKTVMPEYLSPGAFVLIRAIGAGLLFTFIYRVFLYEKVALKDLKTLFICAFFGVAANQILFFEGLNLTSPINASIIMVTTPVTVLVMSFLIIGERITKFKIGGVALGIVGALLLITNKGVGNALYTSNPLGDTFVFLNSAFYAIYLALAKPLMKKYSPLTVITWVFIFGFFLVLPYGLSDFRAINWEIIPPKAWGGIVFVVFGMTFFAYLLNTFALKHLQPSVVSIYIYLQPILATIISLSLGNDNLSLIKIFSAILIFGGVYLVSRPVERAS
jgi:drug/metabolite transporter (DMT)-like permease